MRVYLAGSDQARAAAVAKTIEESGHTIASSWVHGEFKRTREYSVEQRVELAEKITSEVESCDILILLADENMVPGGKFVEFGIALGMDKLVAVVGRRENLLCWHPNVNVVDSDAEIIDVIS